MLAAMGKEAVMLLRDAECSILLVWFSLRDGTSRTGRPLPQVMQSVFETMAQLYSSGFASSSRKDPAKRERGSDLGTLSQANGDVSNSPEWDSIPPPASQRSQSF